MRLVARIKMRRTTQSRLRFAARVGLRLAARVGLRLAAPCLLTCFMPLQAASASAPNLVIKTGAHAHFARAVFDCPQLTAYQVTQAGNVLHVALTTAATPQIVTARTREIKRVMSTRKEGVLHVNIVTAAGATYKDFRWDNKIIIDVYPGKENKPAKPEKEAAVKEPLQEKPVAAPISLAPQKSKAEKSVASRTEDKIKSLIARLTAGDFHKAPAKAPPKNALEKTPSGPAVQAAPVTGVDSGPVLSDPEEIAAAGMPGHVESLLPIWNLSITQPDGGVLSAAVPDASVPAPPLVPPGAAGQTATVTVSSLTPLRLAVFTRADVLWIVANVTGTDVQPPMVKGAMATFISPLQTLPLVHGTAFRYLLPSKLYPVVSKQNLSWSILLLPAPPPAARQPLSALLRIETEPKTNEAMLAAYLRGAGNVLPVVDPAVGDKLFVVPSSFADDAVSVARHMPDLDILPAATGMVVRPLIDHLSVRRIQLEAAAQGGGDKSGAADKKTDMTEAAQSPPQNQVVAVTAPFGLAVTPNGTMLRLVGSPSAAENNDADRLFDFPSWRHGGLEKLQRTESEMIEQVAEATTPEERAGRLMDLAKLYFANNFGQEALAVLDLVKHENPHITSNPDFLAVRGAANAEAGHYNGALDDLSNPEVRAVPEVNLWLGYAAAATEQWKMAENSFPKSNRLLLQYPDNLAVPFTIYMAEAALHLGHTAEANALLGSINQTSTVLGPHYYAAINYLRGISYAQEGEPEKAEALWRPVVAGLDRLYHAKASLSLARLLLQQKKITLKEAIDRVDSLRFAWRGDGLEVDILHTLGALKVQDGEILSGMEDMKQAAALAESLNDDPSPIHDDMRRVFVDLFTSNDSGKIKPLQLVAIYNEFSTLTPPGPEGTTIQLNYIDDLISIDLLGKAAKQMEGVMSTNLPDGIYAALGVKLTAVYLLDSAPQKALLALAKSARPWLPQHLREERVLLKARALSQMKKTDEAIEALKGMHSTDATRLKANVLWRAQRWGDAAAAIESLLPDPSKPLDEKSAQYVINDAVAWKLAGNADKLEALRQKYQAAMAKTKRSATFDVVTRNGGDSALGDRAQMLKIAGEVDMFKDFLDSYKAGLGDSGS